MDIVFRQAFSICKLLNFGNYKNKCNRIANQSNPDQSTQKEMLALMLKSPFTHACRAANNAVLD